MGMGGRLASLLLVAFPAIAMAQFPDCAANPKTALPAHDWSKSGYRQGAALPKRAATLDYPEGRFTIDRQIILLSGDVLRGAGKDKTILYFPGGLKQMGIPCRNGKIITVTGPSTGDCYDWESTADTVFMGVIGARGSEIGIEDLTIEFPAQHEWTHYGNWLYTSGFNGIEFKKGSSDCWVRNVSIKGADNGVMVSYSSAITLEGLDVYAREGGGHNLVAYNGSTRIVTNGFRMYGTSAHGLTVNQGGSDGVFANGWMENGKLEPDHSCGENASTAICTQTLLISNVSGKIASIQTKDRNGTSIESRWTRWNVGAVDRCPLDAYSAQGGRPIAIAPPRRTGRAKARIAPWGFSLDGRMLRRAPGN